MKIKTIDVNVKEWFDKVYGNSYFAGYININYGMKTEKVYPLFFQYGYGEHYIDMAKQLLIKENIIKCDDLTALWRYCNENKIILRTSKQEKCNKKELLSIG